jgi:hypothetical protein
LATFRRSILLLINFNFRFRQSSALLFFFSSSFVFEFFVAAVQVEDFGVADSLESFFATSLVVET